MYEQGGNQGGCDFYLKNSSKLKKFLLKEGRLTPKTPPDYAPRAR